MRYEQEISHCSYVVPVKFIFPAFCLQLFFFFYQKACTSLIPKIGVFIEGNLRCWLFVICSELFVFVLLSYTWLILNYLF